MPLKYSSYFRMYRPAAKDTRPSNPRSGSSEPVAGSEPVEVFSSAAFSLPVVAAFTSAGFRSTAVVVEEAGLLG